VDYVDKPPTTEWYIFTPPRRYIIRPPLTGLRADRAAVEAALREPWSSGQVEGTINKLKLLKHQMYGRANVDLLEARLMSAA